LPLPSSLFSPYQIIYADTFTQISSSLDRQLPLYACLRLLRQTLQAIVNDSSIQSRLFSSSSIVRIEHAISHGVDPLCWLQAQQQQQQQREAPPLLYFATVEGTLETAVYGSSYTYQGNADDDEYWKLVARLPEKSRLYGGQRFDVQTFPSQEWKDFGPGLWMLPALELRKEPGKTTTTTLAMHLHSPDQTVQGFVESAQQLLRLLEHVTDASVPAVPPTTLPPVLSRESNYGPHLDGQEIYERGVTAALEAFDSSNIDLDKVVLARRIDLTFGPYANQLSALDVLRKWKFASQPGGHLFYIHPGGNGAGEFFGCTPERLFQIQNGMVLSEALAGTRPRGSTQQADEELSRELFASDKDQAENLITGTVIRNTFDQMLQRGWLQMESTLDKMETANGDTTPTRVDSITGGRFFVRRLRHLQHICQRFQGQLTNPSYAMDAAKFLLSNLHPTPAMGGFPKANAIRFIREHESVGFDRGFYSGPLGYVGRDSAEIVVGIRSGLLTRLGSKTTVSVYAGAGIVPGSTVQGEWAETSYKLAVVSSIFPQSPITLQGAPSPNAAWSQAFIEELIRNGVTRFYICPGSRSTPLVAAVAKAVRSNVGIVHALSIHDERGAGFRAVGYGRGASRPAAVITSSGTAIANLYPAIIEAGMDGVPLLILTADRPYESRDTGANQAIDQVKAFSSSYVRWFRDILPPHDGVPVAVAFADAAHAVSTARKLRGPVHLNIQFRENLAPDAGPIRNDNRIGSATNYDGLRFTDVPGFQRWSIGGGQWQKSFSVASGVDAYLSNAVGEIAQLISESKRGIIVVGNLRTPTAESHMEDASQMAQVVSNFAQSIGFPIFAGVQSGSLRFDSPAVVPFAEHLLRNPSVRKNLKPDLVLQFGAPLVTTEVPGVITATMSEGFLNHVLVHPHHPSERADPDFTVTHKVSAEITPFLKELSDRLENLGIQCSSSLAPLVTLGRRLGSEMPSIISESAKDVTNDRLGQSVMTEPEVVLTMSRILSESSAPELSLFISNSMPVRDAEAFLYPISDIAKTTSHNSKLRDVGINRGASGIDGIIATATGFAGATGRPTTLIIGDVAALHDINSLHALKTGTNMKEAQAQKFHPLTTIVLNNDGGGIFSFLPIARHGNDVSFDEFFGTPTNTFSFEKGSDAFGIPFQHVTSSDSFHAAYVAAMQSQEASIIEVEVVPREINVAVHKEITKRATGFIDSLLNDEVHTSEKVEKLPTKLYTLDNLSNIMIREQRNPKTMVLLHGWMGDKSEWDEVAENLVQSLSSDWSIISIDLPGHGQSAIRYASDMQLVRKALSLEEMGDESLSIDDMAKSVLSTLHNHYEVNSIDALAGYSLGGRVALAMRRLCSSADASQIGFDLVSDSTKIALLGAYPGDLAQVNSDAERALENKIRMSKDDALSAEIVALSNRACLSPSSPMEDAITWSTLLDRWYGAPLWGGLKGIPGLYTEMLNKRVEAMATRGADLAAVLTQCSPPRCRQDDWRAVLPKNTMFLAGGLDFKYSTLGREWSTTEQDLQYVELPSAGHALLVEAASEVTDAISNFLQDKSTESSPPYPADTAIIPTVEKPAISQAEKVPVPVVGQAISTAAKRPRQQRLVSETDERDLAGCIEKIGSLDLEAFTINLVDGRRSKKGVFGIGWGDNARVKESNKSSQRSGFIVQILSLDGANVGVGEVSPLKGLHTESFGEAEEQLEKIATGLLELDPMLSPSFDASRILSLDGSLGIYIDSLRELLGFESLLPSVKSGLEMALLSVASQIVRAPIHQALVDYSPAQFKPVTSSGSLALNGLITRGSSPIPSPSLPGREYTINYSSLKVKVGHQDTKVDVSAIAEAFQVFESKDTPGGGMVRADANRAFDYASAIHFASALDGIDVHAAERFEYVEEPLEKQSGSTSNGQWSLADQVDSLERWYKHTAIPYALDESLSDLANVHHHDFEAMIQDIRAVFPNPRGCAALALKPSLLGLELSIQLARVARQELGIGAVFTSSFDSGVGLAYASFLGSLSDASPSRDGVKAFPHGLSTFSMLAEDSLSPPFGSYVNENGLLSIASLSRSLYGLGLDEIRDSSIVPPPPDAVISSERKVLPDATKVKYKNGASNAKEYEASTATSSSGREISVVVSLPLPFSADIACARFTDLPQQPRWSPWITSVTYLDAGSETEWALQVRGVSFRWRATSTLLQTPYKGIRWDSVSGLKNTGVVEFIPAGETSSLMKVRMTIITPRILSSLFKGTSVFFEDFLRNKLLKWSLEMFRDVVKGDLALEEGDVDLGDALFGAVEGKAFAIEATLSLPLETDDGGLNELG
jgi:2-succinyl-5-enolpyruvyl-6-hydroxy-3-cyclohexene-1-carboxylate synthase